MVALAVVAVLVVDVFSPVAMLLTYIPLFFCELFVGQGHLGTDRPLAYSCPSLCFTSPFPAFLFHRSARSKPSFPCARSSNGGSEMLATNYKGMVVPQTRPGHNMTIIADLENLNVPAEQLLKR